jgi:uncharacterized cupredoxin-like copper-binding protein/Cu/Ag efflux protein CusF
MNADGKADERRWPWIGVTMLVLACSVGGVADAHTDVKKAKIDYSKADEMAFGKAADPARAQRTIKVDMADTMRYTPAEISVNRGESVRFVATNRGKVMHEMVLGTREELTQHAEMMRQHPGMEHDEPHMLHVAPGKTGEMGWQFTRPGEFYYGCLVPGHFEAGMVGTIKVAQAGNAPPVAVKEGGGDKYTEGEVRKVDKAAGKITLRHGPIASLDMPAMTMVFRARDPAMLDTVRAGDKVRFTADKVKGVYTVTHIEAAK